jgi:adenine-specific DNA-methyltransferase
MATTGNGKGTSKSEKVTSIKHTDKRANIPTEELRDFVAKDEQEPTTSLYPRDTSLDPQLVWKGKDEQDSQDLQVPVVPIYIQEKIHPQAIVDDLLQKQDDSQLNLFSDFNGGPKEFEQKIDFYHHEQNWTNRMILGDSLLVMNSLGEKEGLKGKVQVIYIDPPYGIKFGSNWQVSTRKTEVKDNKYEDTTKQPEQIRAFRDTWQLGIHSYLSYLRDRLQVTRELLTTSGSVFVQISEDNVHLVRNVMDEIFGSENFVSMISFVTTSGFAQASALSRNGDYILWYAKEISQLKSRTLWIEASDRQGYNWLELEDGSRRSMTAAERRGEVDLPKNSRIYKPSTIVSSGGSNTPQPFEFEGKTYNTPPNNHWKASYPDGMNRLVYANRIHKAANSIQYVRFEDDFGYKPLTNLWTDTATGNFTETKTFVVQTSTKVIERCIQLSSDPGDLVLDPTCGSGTTAISAEKLGRRWITCDTSRVALSLTRTRLMSARLPYYLLADSHEGQIKTAELNGASVDTSVTNDDIRKGFVYKRVPHVTLRAIANSLELKEGMTKEQIDRVVAKNSESELLFDSPIEDVKRVRVCGPFSVESLSPHRVLSLADGDTNGTVTEKEAKEQQDFSTMILDNLKRAGVQNTIKNERLNFTQLDASAGRWINAIGTYEDLDGATKRAAISIGPEHGTVGPEQIKEAAKEAVQGVGFDLLIVCGFAFDPHVAEESKRYGNLTVLPTKMNPDLAMGDELLKKTGAGNLFMVFGEPDTEVSREKDGNIVVTLNGLDIYDPTTGSIRSSSTDDIACWFLDTNYNGESFFVRHAYFLGSDQPMEKLKKALRQDIDSDAWESINSNVSRPFPKPPTGKLAIKVINHYGDEVLKVFDLV